MPKSTVRRALLKAGAVASFALAARPAGAQPPTATKTYVLVHGSWMGGWFFDPVADHLRAAGHRVLTPTQTGLGERKHLLSRDITLQTFIEDISNVIEWEELHDVIFVGHSSAGGPITGVADRIPDRIRHVVYLDAFIFAEWTELLQCFCARSCCGKAQVRAGSRRNTRRPTTVQRAGQPGTARCRAARLVQKENDAASIGYL